MLLVCLYDYVCDKLIVSCILYPKWYANSTAEWHHLVVAWRTASKPIDGPSSLHAFSFSTSLLHHCQNRNPLQIQAQAVRCWYRYQALMKSQTWNEGYSYRLLTTEFQNPPIGIGWWNETELSPSLHLLLSTTVYCLLKMQIRSQDSRDMRKDHTGPYSSQMWHFKSCPVQSSLSLSSYSCKLQIQVLKFKLHSLT